MLEYKGYIGHVTYDDEFEIFHGDVVNMRDVVTFQGKTVEEIKQAFRDSINDYLQWAKEKGFEPCKPFSGKFMLRLDPELHRNATIAAKTSGLSLNAWVAKAIEKESQKQL